MMGHSTLQEQSCPQRLGCRANATSPQRPTLKAAHPLSRQALPQKVKPIQGDSFSAPHHDCLFGAAGFGELGQARPHAAAGAGKASVPMTHFKPAGPAGPWAHEPDEPCLRPLAHPTSTKRRLQTKPYFNFPSAGSSWAQAQPGPSRPRGS